MCKNCKLKPVIKLPNSNISLCKSCFIKYFERKVRKTIRQYKLFKKGQHVGVALSGGKDSLTTLYILNKITKPQKTTKLTAIAIDEGIKGYRDETLKLAKKVCKELDIPLKTTSYKKEFKQTLDQILKKSKIKPCSVCGVFRRFLLNKQAQKLNFDVIATGHNLDDEAQSILMNQFRNNIAASARLGPITGIKTDKKFIRRIKPLYFLTEKEIMTYAFLKNLATPFNECPYSKNSYRGEIRNLINNFDKKYPSSKHSIINSFIEILPILKKNYKTKELKYCKTCGEPSSKEICQTCNLIKEIR
jgi:tRNA-5-methyluridine54 2-sulfurtransferase